MYRTSLGARVTRMTLHPNDGDRLFFFDHKIPALWERCYRNQNCRILFLPGCERKDRRGFVKKVP